MVYRIYYDEKNAIVADEEQRRYFFTSLFSAREIAKQYQVTKNLKTALNQREEMLVGFGYRKERFL